MYLKSSPPTCPGEPLLDDALRSLPGFCFAYAISSCTEPTGSDGDTASNRWPLETSATGCRSRSMS